VKIAEGSGVEVAADERWVASEIVTCPARPLLQTRRHVGRVADGGVVHAQVASDAANHDEAGVESLPRAEADASRR
jgi:hypothetical protein